MPVADRRSMEIDTPRVPQIPPTLLRGRTAWSWEVMELLAFSLASVVFIGGCLWMGLQPSQPDRDRAAGFLVAGTAIAIVIWIASMIGYRRAAFRERAAGYTTVYGDKATIDLPSRGRPLSITLFSTVGLWQLDHRTGAVLRRPAGETPAQWGEEREFQDFAEQLKRD